MTTTKQCQEVVTFFVICSYLVNLIWAVFNFCVKQLFFIKKCQPITYWPIAIRAVHPPLTQNYWLALTCFVFLSVKNNLNLIISLLVSCKLVNKYSWIGQLTLSCLFEFDYFWQLFSCWDKKIIKFNVTFSSFEKTGHQKCNFYWNIFYLTMQNERINFRFKSGVSNANWPGAAKD